jgi:translation initiation factor IF-2
MTTVELAKRTGQSVITLQEFLVNLGEKVVSEFDPLKIDVAELVVMVFPFPKSR